MARHHVRFNVRICRDRFPNDNNSLVYITAWDMSAFMSALRTAFWANMRRSVKAGAAMRAGPPLRRGAARSPVLAALVALARIVAEQDRQNDQPEQPAGYYVAGSAGEYNG